MAYPALDAVSHNGLSFAGLGNLVEIDSEIWLPTTRFLRSLNTARLLGLYLLPCLLVLISFTLLGLYVHQVFMEKNVINSTSIAASACFSLNSENFNESDEDEDENEVDLDDEDDASVDDCNVFEYCSDKNYFYKDNDDDYSSMQAQFDNVDIPPGVEASVTWLKETTLSSSAPIPLELSVLCGSARSSACVTASASAPSTENVRPLFQAIHL
ncbi:hypothetical protein F511_07918 [Dorcoceras hygrometricum]|uniref:Uncharacterized protein n=1 Tax=Dorcoceras hygrometricum TaxID=472368 RepID=A0A2Z7CNJ7_9LAMI|nr:hypothetical protein F511_07918 [Dorcoceras hygrometricum]